MLAESGSKEEAEIASGKARSAEDSYRAFCDKTGRTPRWNRTEIY